MALITKPPVLDESVNTTELSPRNVADVLAQELSGIASAITGGSDKVPKTDIATVEPSNTASRAYSIGELVYVNGNLYKVITAISIGATFTVGTNIQSTNVSDAITNAVVSSASLESDVTATHNIVVRSGCNIWFHLRITTTSSRSLYGKVATLPKPYGAAAGTWVGMVYLSSPFASPSNYSVYIDGDGNLCAGGNGLPAGNYVLSGSYITAK